jgi:hypothetical protein
MKSMGINMPACHIVVGGSNMAQITEPKKNPNIELIEQIAEKNIELTRMLATNGKSKKSNRFNSFFVAF